MSAAVSQITGSGLSPIDILAAQAQHDVPAELRDRASVAFSRVASAINTIASTSRDSIAVLYFSEGYLEELVPQAAGLIESATRANASIYTVDPRGLAGLQKPSALTPDQWNAYVRATEKSLRTLALQTQGRAVTVNELYGLVSNLAAMPPGGNASPSAADIPCHEEAVK